jgi:lipoyl(octanoyl) transferase
MEGVSHMPGRALKPQSPDLAVFDLGTAPYLPVQELQKRLRLAVADGRVSGALLLLEHEPVITLGGRAGLQDLRSRDGGHLHPPEVVISERGGQATLHAPGQLVSYPVVPIPGRDLTAYVRGLEQANILLLAELGIHAERQQGRPGLYVAGEKISSVGLRCQRWVSSHGTSLNVDVDLELFDHIVSCGQPGLRQTSIAAVLGTAPPMSAIKALYIRSVIQVFAWNMKAMKRVPYDRVGVELGLDDRRGAVPA